MLYFVENEVYAWGNNAMGQCGQGHGHSPITRPKKVVGFEGVIINQISAGLFLYKQIKHNKQK